MSAVNSKPLRDIANTGKRLVAVGESGLIVISDDQGSSWVQASVPVSVDLNAVYFANEQQGWAVGHGAAILHTNDGGQTWNKQLDGRELAAIISTYFEQGHSGLSVERAQAYLEAILNMTRPGPGQFFMGVWFDTTGQQGYAVGPFGLFMGSRDGGKSWQPLNTQIENNDLLHLTAIREVDGTLAITGERGHVWTQGPGAQTFVARQTGYGGTLFGLAGTSHVMLAYGLRGHVFRSSDAGLNWSPVNNYFKTGVIAGAPLADGSLILVSQAAQVATLDPQGDRLTPITIANPSLFTGVVGLSANQFALVGLNGVTTHSVPVKAQSSMALMLY
ncbi:WD40/YVTN/BNR-like repeat-containing protein [Pseudomonas sp. 5P_3.1_Bac2]|uniref:WD40/YVTN/BNR-like repeat-containing protein n=1 Tax=Pseudomonas sp. 5P_3.1_Bac2 TaxID=2971617 RepID=UPI0021C8B10B|nr:YCF48-related protein [Pseudomonas sp. 5P_3.1_Bac2]MCU1717662.1 YCF48-related protein [Pseudomonas sp. 5P_3.1_Bac2]